MIPATLIFPVRAGEVLLGMKKRRFGTGKWNGFGGKTLEGEDIRTAVLRELKEESGLTARPEDLEPAGRLSFYSVHDNKLNWDVEVFLLREWEGEPVETEEMRPEWHSVEALPFGSMWPDDRYWLPQVLAGKRIKVAKFNFDATAEGFERMEIEFI